jgi:hypothetical protein
MARRALLLILASAVAACSTAGTAGTAGSRSPRNIITAEDIASTPVATAYDLVQRLRPDFLRTRGSNQVHNQAQVYVDGIHLGALNTLRTIRAGEVLGIRYLNAVDATTRYGTGHPGGVIEVQTR